MSYSLIRPLPVFNTAIIITIITPRRHKCKFKASFVCHLLSGSLGLICPSLLCSVRSGSLQSFHSSVVCPTLRPLPSARLLVIHLLYMSASTPFTSPPPSLIYALTHPPTSFTRPSSILPSITLSHKWTVKIPSEYRSERALISNELRMNKRWPPLT